MRPNYQGFLFLVLVKICMNIEEKVDQDHLNIVILGDIGLSEAQSNIKKRIVKEIRKINNSTAFNLGMILGDNVYQHGLEEGKFKPLYEVFSGSFRRTEFDFNFLTILGNHDYEGSPATQIRYHYELDNRFYLPYRYYTYEVSLTDGTTVSFYMADSTPIIEKDFIPNSTFHDHVQIKHVSNYFKKQKKFNYTFIVMHHAICPGFGPHLCNVGSNIFQNITNEYNVSAIISGHNHNMQHLYPSQTANAHMFTVGNGSKRRKINPRYNGTKGWYHDKSGGFGRLIITKFNASFMFYDDRGEILRVVEIESFK